MGITEPSEAKLVFNKVSVVFKGKHEANYEFFQFCGTRVDAVHFYVSSFSWWKSTAEKLAKLVRSIEVNGGSQVP